MTPQDIVRLSDKLKAVLQDEDRALQGAALADCVAYWVAGHVHRLDQEATMKIRAGLLQGFVQMVVRILPIADQMVRAHARNNPPKE